MGIPIIRSSFVNGIPFTSDGMVDNVKPKMAK